MSEKADFVKENKEFQVDNNDLSPLELLMVGGSSDIAVDGEKIFFNSETLLNLCKNPKAIKTILTPPNLIEGKKTLEELRQARANRQIFSKMRMYAFKSSDGYFEKEIEPFLKLGEPNEDGQVDIFGVYFLQKGEKFNLSQEDAQKEIKFEGSLGKITKYMRTVNGVAEYRINMEGK